MGLAPFVWLEKSAAILESMRDHLPGAILIHGRRGAGAYELGANFARSLVCAQPHNGQACGHCEECRLVEAGTHPDLLFILSEVEAAARPKPWETKKKASQKGKAPSRTISIEQVRSITDFLSVTAHRGALKVVVVYPADTMTTTQSSALLKTLEEPPPDSVIILISDDLDAMLPTVRSRCQLIGVNSPTKAQGQAFLAEQGVSDPAQELARLGGLPLKIFELDEAHKLDRAKETVLVRLLARADALSAPEVLAALRTDVPMIPFVALLQRWCADLAASFCGLAPSYFPAEAATLKQLGQRVDPQKLFAYVDELGLARLSANHPLDKKLSEQDLLMRYPRVFTRG